MHTSADIHIANELETPRQTVHLVEADVGTRMSMADFLRENGFDVAEYDDPDEFLSHPVERHSGCVVINALGTATLMSIPLPFIVVSQGDDIRASIDAMKSGAVDFLLKPLDRRALLRAVEDALELEHREKTERLVRQFVKASAMRLTPRERQVFEAVTSGLMNKQIAYDLGISEIMVKVHRGRVMRKMNSRTLPDLVRKFDIVRAFSASGKIANSYGLN